MKMIKVIKATHLFCGLLLYEIVRTVTDADGPVQLLSNITKNTADSVILTKCNK